MDLSTFFTPLRRWWWLLLAATLIAIASSYFYVRDQPALYEARTTLLIGRAFADPNPTSNELTLGQQLATTYADLAQRQPVRPLRREAHLVDADLSVEVRVGRRGPVVLEPLVAVGEGLFQGAVVDVEVPVEEVEVAGDLVPCRHAVKRPANT